jgi:tetratricopeptide (TPR) repeat protein
VYGNKEEYDRAIADYTQALKLDPKYALAYSNRGFAYEQKGQKTLAIQDYEKALAIAPSNEWVQDAFKRLRGW